MKIKLHKKFKSNSHIFILTAIILCGGLLRFYNLNWDNYQIFHPDERNLANATTKIVFFKSLNPEFFAYGGLPVYLYRASGDFLVLMSDNKEWIYDWGHINLIGRSYSALFSTLTIFFVYFLSRRFLNKVFSLISAFIFSFTVSSIQIAHFATTESFLILILIILSYCSLLFYEKPNFKKAILLGFLLGIGTAAKITAISFVIIPLLSFFLIFYKHKNKALLSNFSNLIFYLLSTIFFFVLFSPYTFLSWNKFMESMRYESGVVSGKLVVPYTHQFDKAIPYIFEITNLFWQMGFIFIFSILGFLFCVYFLLKKKKIELLFLLVFPFLYFLYVGSWHTKFIRYTSLLLPFFAIYASFAFWVIFRKSKIFGTFLIIIFFITTFLWAISYLSIYIEPQTRLNASLWMYKNIPPGSKILTEHWDDGLPIRIEGHNQNQFMIEQLTIYDNELGNKKKYYADKLSKADNIILTTRRLYGTLRYLPETFPVTSRYYDKLFGGDLGYKKVAEFSSYPSLLGLEINDDKSEESFQVYDHPTVIVFKNLKKLSEEKILQKLNN